MATDVMHEFGVHDDGLDLLLAALTAPGEPAELQSEQTTLAAFRTVILSQADRGAASWPAAPGPFATRPLRRPVRWRPRLAAAAAVYCTPAKAKSSARERASARSVPCMAEVTVLAPSDRTPRSVMHECSACSTTPAPRGFRRAARKSAICLVIRSCVCGRAA